MTPMTCGLCMRHACDMKTVIRARGRDRRHPRSASDCRATQIVERESLDSGLAAHLAPRRPESVRCPGPSTRVGEDDRAAFLRPIEKLLQWRAHTYDDGLASLELSQPDVRAVV